MKKINLRVLNVEVQNALKHNAPFGAPKDGRLQVFRLLLKNQNEKGKGKTNGTKGKSKTPNLARLETQSYEEEKKNVK